MERGKNLSRPARPGVTRTLAAALISSLALAACGGPPEPAARPVLQGWHGHRPAPRLVASFDGLGEGFRGPQGTARTRNPSDNSLAVGPDHVVQTVNSSMAIFSKDGEPLYGPVPTANVFRGFGGPCEQINNGDAVVRYDQVAGRWLVVMPIFRRLDRRADEPAVPTPADGPVLSTPGREDQPGTAVRLFEPAPTEEEAVRRERRPPGDGSFAMCYAVSVGEDPFGPYWRYEFVRPLFPDYPRPAVWPDGWYLPTSTGDDVIQKHVCVAERDRMLAGEPAREVCFVLDGVGFLNNADLDGFELPPPGSPNPMMATGGVQLEGVFADSVIHAWNVHVDWTDPARSRAQPLEPVPVAPYRYLCDGQLTECVPQPGTDRRLDSQGDKIMARMVYRRIGDRESVVAVHSVEAPPGGGVRWYEFRIGPDRAPALHQQGTYAPDSLYRWLGSPAMDRAGNIGIGFSYGGASEFAGQRFAGRLDGDSLGVLTVGEAILAQGGAAQEYTYRWEDYTQTAVDPSDDCTLWYVGDYLRPGAESYSTRIGAFRMEGCMTGR